jgi:hypothetical protein
LAEEAEGGGRPPFPAEKEERLGDEAAPAFAADGAAEEGGHVIETQEDLADDVVRGRRQPCRLHQSMLILPCHELGFCFLVFEELPRARLE